MTPARAAASLGLGALAALFSLLAPPLVSPSIPILAAGHPGGSTRAAGAEETATPPAEAQAATSDGAPGRTPDGDPSGTPDTPEKAPAKTPAEDAVAPPVEAPPMEAPPLEAPPEARVVPPVAPPVEAPRPPDAQAPEPPETPEASAPAEAQAPAEALVTAPPPEPAPLKSAPPAPRTGVGTAAPPPSRPPAPAEAPPAARPDAAPAPEPEGYHGEPYRSPVPATLQGAEVVGDEAARALWRAGAPFIDMLPTAVRPANLPPDTLWRDPPHETIPGAVWLANTGYEALDPETERYFRDALARISEGRMDAPMVFFCQRDCWMSWNGAKRAVAQGFERVFWYPDGTDGWRESGGVLETVTPYALREAATPGP